MLRYLLAQGLEALDNKLDLITPYLDAIMKVNVLFDYIEPSTFIPSIKDRLLYDDD